jgi:predicted short-subunit dehydrogenase-like oxidoreductase (DUF2520 family)
MRIVLIGAGRLATNLAPALQQAGHRILQVYSRTAISAATLAERVGAKSTDNLREVLMDADVFIMSVTDTALPLLVAQLCKGREQAVFLHTAGSVPMSVFKDRALHYGVLYPMQSFSKERNVSFAQLPMFVESNDEKARQVVTDLAHSVSSNVTALDSEGRRHLHLAAVFACNFANHCYQISAEILSKYGLPFEIMLPLIDETSAKVHELSPVDAQTGPAVRYDEVVLDAQQKLLGNNPLHAQIYQLMSKSIHRSQQIKEESVNP